MIKISFLTFILLVLFSSSGFSSTNISIDSVDVGGLPIEFESNPLIHLMEINFERYKNDNIKLNSESKINLIRFTVVSNEDTEDLLINIASPQIDQMYLLQANGEVLRHKTGDLVHIDERSYDDPYLVLPITLNKNEEVTIILMTKSNFSTISPIVIEDKESFHTKNTIRNIFFGLFSGVMMVMFLYNLFIFISTRDKKFFYYIGYVLFIFIAQSNLLGISYYIFKSYPVLNNATFFIGSGLCGIFGAMFIREFLNTKINSSFFDKGLTIIKVVYIIQILLFIFGFNSLSFMLIQVGGLLVVINFGLIAITQTIRRTPFAAYYLIAWLPILIGLIVLILREAGYLGYNSFTNNIFFVSVMLETIMLSIALARQINTLQEENENANNRIVLEIQKNKELIQNQNITLEKKVTERTAELQTALDDLKAAQSQLVQSEKMASLGTLTAGIAHEINNPINFVTANVSPLRENLAALTKLVDAYKSCDYNNLEEELARLNKLENELELDYLLKETPQLIDGIEEGAKRTHTIVDGLKTFSRGDAGHKSKADINLGIRSTISVLKSRLNQLKISLDLQSDLPKLSCQIGKINQVVLNLLNNAIDSLDEKNGPNSSQSELVIKSFLANDEINILITDNGAGISSEVQTKIMEPFFTTKEVGKGTGLGLSISYSIIEDHGGDMTLESEFGVGTTFTISLPLA